MPVLAYVEPVTSRASWHRNPLWARLALPAAIVYAGVLACVVGHELLSGRPWYGRPAHAILRALAATSPLGVVALGLGVLGHFSPRGRRRAGPAVWLVAVTPGAGTILYLLGMLAVGNVRDDVVSTCLGVMGVNVVVVLALRNRVLKESPEERAFEGP